MSRSTVLLFIILLLPAFSVVSAPMSLPEQEHYTLNGDIRYLEDQGQTMTLAQVREVPPTQWQVQTDRAFNRGINDSAWWLRIEAANPGRHTAERLLELAYPLLDHVDVYVFDGERMLAAHRLGDARPYHQRPLDHHHFLVPLVWQRDQTLTIFVRLESSGPLWAPFSLWTYEAFVGQDGARALARGLFTGALAIFVVYNLFLFLSVRSWGYLYYVGSYACLLLFAATFAGLGFRYLWPTATAWNNLAVPVLVVGTVVFGNLLCCKLLKLRRRQPRTTRFLVIGSGAGLVLITATFFLPYRWALSLSMAYATGFFGFALIVGVLQLRNGGLTERLFTCGLAVTLVSSLPSTLAAADLMPLNVFSEQSLYYGTIISSLLLSFALASRITLDRHLRQQARQEAILTTQQAKKDLERRVLERTREQERLREHLEALSVTDSLTGVGNRRYLEQCLAQEWRRCGESGRPLSLILLDADHFKRVNDTYGHGAGDACLVELANRTRRCLKRPGDTVARMGGEEFCVLMPETDLDGALVVAGQIRSDLAGAPVCFDGEAIAVTLSAGVSSMVPDFSTLPEALLNQADKAMYAAKEGGRNQVRAHRLEILTEDRGGNQ